MLHVHRAERADRLAAALAEMLAEPLADPFAQEVVAVPARGVERWLTQQLSHRLGRRTGAVDGICAGVRFPSPAALIAEALGIGPDHPWAPDMMVWPLLEVIDESVGEPWCAVLGTHLGAGATEADLMHRRGRRYAVARRLAGLFDNYAAQRPQLTAAWSSGSDTDGLGATLPADLAWQAELWRRLTVRIGVPHPLLGERTASAESLATALPSRLSLFGPTRLPSAHLDLLAELARGRDVHLWVPHPSPALWAGVAADAPLDVVRRSVDPTVLTPDHPLLSALGRDARELQLVLARHHFVDSHHPAPDLPATLLGLLQRQLRDDERPVATTALTAADRSVQVHACHGQVRQVEVLREVLVGLLAADPTLEPRDILVMCPDIEDYAPLIAAAFGLADVVIDGHPAHRLRVRLADRALVQTNPLLATVSLLLDLADSRITASQLLDLAGRPPVRGRFGFTDDDLEQLTRWVTDAGVRWGLDAEHRQAFHLGQFPQGTWRAGLDRILLGATMSEESGQWLGLALPLDDVESSDVDLAGRVAEMVARVSQWLDHWTGPHSLKFWLDTLKSATMSLTQVTAEDGWQQTELEREFAALAVAAGDRFDRTQLRLTDVRALLRGRLGGRPTRANFRTGSLTVCTMVPMRSVPHRVVCLVGLDDGAFPRGARPDGDDALAATPMVGERDRRGEDRQLMLDAMLAATETLVITYAGADERTGAVRPPCVPVGELLDTLDDMATAPGGGPARDQVLTRHPLQPFDVKNVVGGALGINGPFSYDRSALRSARAAAGRRVQAPPFLADPLPAAVPTAVQLAEVTALLVNPARGFLRQRIDVAVPFEEAEPSDALPVELDALQSWSIGDRLLRARLGGADEQRCRQMEWRRGTLPPGPLGQRVLNQVMTEVEPLVNATIGMRTAPATSIDIQLATVGGRLSGTVTGVHDRLLVSVNYSRLGPAHRLRAWLALVMLSAAHPEVTWSAVTIGRGGSGRPQQSTVGPLPAGVATRVADELVDLYVRGLCEPLPLPVKSGHAYADSRHRGRPTEDAVEAARQSWRSGKYPGEDADAAFVRVWGAGAALETLLTPRPRTDEHWSAEQTRFGRLARRLWTPLLDAEHRESL